MFLLLLIIIIVISIYIYIYILHKTVAIIIAAIVVAGGRQREVGVDSPFGSWLPKGHRSATKSSLVMLIRSLLITLICTISDCGSQIPESLSLLVITSKCLLKVQISEGVGPSLQIEL